MNTGTLFIPFLVLNYYFLAVNCTFQLTVLHYNDYHARYKPISDANIGNDCTQEEAEKEQCFGGFARLKGKIIELRRKYNNTILLNAGDFFLGTLWASTYGWKLASYFLNQLNHTAITIGSHEFDDGVQAFIPFMQHFKDPIVVCNVNDSEEKDMQNKYQKKIITTVNGEKIGIVGFTSEQTKFMASPGMLEFSNIIDSVTNEVHTLHENGIKIIIALGYNGIDGDQEICEYVPYVGLVVGGRGHAFLYNGTPPSDDIPIDTYPIRVQKPNGRPCLIVTASSFGKYLGFLQIEFDSEGYPITWQGNPMLLDNTVDEDEEVTEELMEWEQNITELLGDKVGETSVLLDGSIILCRLEECNMGNVIADSMVFATTKFVNDFQWTYASLAVLNSGGIRSSIQDQKINGTVTTGDVLRVLPYRNHAEIIELQGKYIWEMFEHSISEYDDTLNYPIGRFLQVSGFEVTFDFCQPVGHRVTEIYALCNECRIPRLFPLENYSYYRIVMPRFLANGGDGFAVIKRHKISSISLDIVDSQILINYMKERGPIITGIESRITIKSSKSCKANSAAIGAIVVVTRVQRAKCVLTLIVFILWLISLA